MASIPKVTVEVAFDGGPFSTSYTWTDISDYVEGFRVRRGRNSELDRIEAGTLSLTLDNSDGRFTPGKQKSGGNVLSGYSGQYIWDLNGRANNTIMSQINIGQVDDDGKTRVMSRTVYTSGAPVSCYFAVKWLDAGGATLRFVIGTRFVADSSPAVYTHEEAPPAGTATAVLYIYADTYPEGNTGLTAYGEKAEWYKTQPYWPNVIPRRRVRVRTSNLAPKDVSTGGDITRTSAQFSTSHSTGTSNSWAEVPKSGAGSVRVDMGNNGTADYASSVRCGFVSNGKPVGLSKVVAGQTYSARAQVRLGTSSPALSVKMLVRWYDAAGNFLTTSSDSPSVALQNGAWVALPLTGVLAPANAVWAGLSIGTTGGDGGGTGYLFIDEIQFEQGSTLSEWNPGGSIFHGYIEKWPVSTDGLTASVEVSAVDGFSVLGTTELRRPMATAILATNPVGYWPLNDPVGSTRLENAANDTAPASLVASKYGGGTAQLGAASIVPRDGGTAYSLTNVGTNVGTVVDPCDNGRRLIPLGTQLAVNMWVQPSALPSSGTTTSLFTAWNDQGAMCLSLDVASTGIVTVYTRFSTPTGDVIKTFQSYGAIPVSSPTMLTVVVDGGYTLLYWNGDPDNTSGAAVANADLRDIKWASLGGQQAGSLYQQYQNGRYSDFAIWDDTSLFADESIIYDWWATGADSSANNYESEVDRLWRALDGAGWSGQEFVYDKNTTSLQPPDWESGTDALEVAQNGAADASGYVFMDGDGRFTYHSRVRRQSATVRYVLSDSSGFPYESNLEFVMDEDRIINEVAYKRPGGAEGVLRDASSIALYGRKSKTLELSVTKDSVVQDAAYSMLNLYSEPTVRCDSVTLKATAIPSLFLVVLGAEIGDRITLSELPSAAPDSSLDFYVEAVEADVQVNGGTLEWVTTLSLSPADGSDVWILEDATLGRLDRTAVLAY
jgi:hypothetical protein